MFPGTFLLPLGLLLAGWAAQQKLPWIATDIVSPMRGIVINYV